MPVISHNPVLLPTLTYPFHAPMAFEGPHKFDASHFVGAFQKPDNGASWTSHFHLVRRALSAEIGLLKPCQLMEAPVMMLQECQWCHRWTRISCPSSQAYPTV